MNRLIRIAVIILLGLSAAGWAQDKAPDVSGTWEVAFETPMGERTYAAVFAVDKDLLKVIMKSSRGTELKGEGKLSGDQIQWSVVVSAPMGDIPLVFKGRVQGDTMEGTVEMGDAGESPFKAKKTG